MDIKGKSVLDLFLGYVTYDTQSDASSDTRPSTPGQTALAELLVNQLRMLGLSDAAIDAHGRVIATLEATDDAPDDMPAIGLIAHLDTSPDAPGKGVKPRTVYYIGGDIVLNEKRGVVLSPKMFPELKEYVNDLLVVTDGTTLLGADDKAGIAAIISALAYIRSHRMKHGKVCIAFMPDEEIGRGTDGFDVEKFGCNWAYTVDGGKMGTLEYECFNAAEATVTITGRAIHPGAAKGRMLNALQTAVNFHNHLPVGARPEWTEGYEGFFHLKSLSGGVEKAVMTYLVRDHDRRLFEKKKRLLRSIAHDLRAAGHGKITVRIKDQYYNMCDRTAKFPSVAALAASAIAASGLKPQMPLVRGGTDGARLSFMGLPCPNLFTGGHNFHSVYEFLPVRALKKCRETIVNIVRMACDLIPNPNTDK
jgi:tripeptide aminopeptidase